MGHLADKQGRVKFPIEESGVWMLTIIHMIRATENVDADWESFWASFTFQIDCLPGATDER